MSRKLLENIGWKVVGDDKFVVLCDKTKEDRAVHLVSSGENIRKDIKYKAFVNRVLSKDVVLMISKQEDAKRYRLVIPSVLSSAVIDYDELKNITAEEIVDKLSMNMKDINMPGNIKVLVETYQEHKQQEKNNGK